MLLTLILVVIVLVLYMVLKFDNKFDILDKRYQSPLVKPFWGNLYQFIGEQGNLPLVQSWMSISGQNVLVYLSKKPYIIVHEMKMVKFVMESEKLISKPLEYKYLSEIFGTGLITSEGDLWKTHRDLITLAFHKRSFNDFMKIFESQTNTLLLKMRDNIGMDSFDIMEKISLWSLDIISEATLGFKIDAQNSITKFVSVFRKLPDVVFNKCFISYRFNWLYYVSSQYEDERKINTVIKGFLKNAIRERKRKFGKGVDGEAHSFLDHLIRTGSEGRGLTDDEIYDEILTIMFTGYCKMNNALCFCLYLLSINANVQDKVYKELVGNTDNNTIKRTSFKHLNNLTYLEQVIKESLRLYPPISVYARVLEEDVKLDNNDIILPKGVSTVFIPYILHRDPILYPNPKKFDPERFSAENERNRNPYAYIAFSAGSRNCVGQKFAMLQLKMALCKLLLEYEILPAVPRHEIQPAIRMTLESVNGIRIGLKCRSAKI